MNQTAQELEMEVLVDGTVKNTISFRLEENILSITNGGKLYREDTNLLTNPDSFATLAGMKVQKLYPTKKITTRFSNYNHKSYSIK